MRPRGPAHGPQQDRTTLWRAAPQLAVTLPELSWLLLGAMLLVCLGVLLGATWTTQATQPKLRQQAEERRKLNDEWVAVRAARQQFAECPRCGCALAERDPYSPTWLEGSPDDD